MSVVYKYIHIHTYTHIYVLKYVLIHFNELVSQHQRCVQFMPVIIVTPIISAGQKQVTRDKPPSQQPNYNHQKAIKFQLI